MTNGTNSLHWRAFLCDGNESHKSMQITTTPIAAFVLQLGEVHVFPAADQGLSSMVCDLFPGQTFYHKGIDDIPLFQRLTKELPFLPVHYFVHSKIPTKTSRESFLP